MSHHSHTPVHTAAQAISQFGLESLLHAAVQQGQRNREIMEVEGLRDMTDPFERIRGHFHKALEQMDYLERQGFSYLDY